MDLGFCLAKPLLTIDKLPPNQAKANNAEGAQGGY